MAAYGTLEHTLKEILQVVNPLQEDHLKRHEIIDELRLVIESVGSLRGARVEAFGSFVSDLFTQWGDLDISVDLLNGSYISSAGKKRKQTLLGEIQKALRQKGGWRRLRLVPNARVPILKFESSRQRISCDVSVDNLLGQMKSKILFLINAIDGRFRDMVLLVKEWAKAHDINNSKNGTFNSYSLSLLVIFHFQTCVPAILPPLKDIYPGNIVDDLTGVRDDVERHITETCDANVARFRADKYRQVNQSSLSELFISFLAKFSDISLRAPEQGICPYKGTWEYIQSNMRWLPKTYAIFVEDPFERPENTARSIRDLTRISEAFQSTHHMLSSANQNRNHSSLLTTLVPLHVSQIIARGPVRNPSYNGRRHNPIPQVQRSIHTPSQPQLQFQNTRIERSVHSPSQPQLQFQNMRIESRSNNLITQRPVQAYTIMQRPIQVSNNLITQRPVQASNNSIAQRPVQASNNSIAQRPVQAYNNQGQRMWRQKSDR